MWAYPRVIAHRGGGCLAPENTIAALQCGLDWGFRAVEFDVMLTQDQVPVLMHDEVMGRTVAGQAKIAETPVRHVLQLDAGVWFSPEFAGARVPTYLEALAFCRRNGIWMNVELKPSCGAESVTGTRVAQLTQKFYRNDMQGDLAPLFSSFSEEALIAAKLAAPDIPRALLVEHIPVDWHVRLRALDAVALHCNHLHLTAALAQAITLAGYGLCCYTVNQIDRAQEIQSWGVDAFCTDRLDLFGLDSSIFPRE